MPKIYEVLFVLKFSSN